MLVAGIGNIFFRDDGFGSAVATALLSNERQRRLPAGVRVVDYGIRGMHLTYDLLDGVDALVLIDAVPARTARGEQPGDLVTLEIGTLQITTGELASGAVDAHGMSPLAVLSSLAAMGGAVPPTYLVGCVPADACEGMGLSEPVSAAVEPAADTVVGLVHALASGELTPVDQTVVG